MKRRRTFAVRASLILPGCVLVFGCQVILGLADEGSARPDASVELEPNVAGATGDGDASTQFGAGGSQRDASFEEQASGGVASAGADADAQRGFDAGAGAGGEGEDGGIEFLLEYRLAVGREHVCAIRNNGAVFCFGSNRAGQRGNDLPEIAETELLAWTRTLRNNERPYSAAGLRAGADSTCGTSPGQVWCWGENDVGQVGRGPRHPGYEALAVLVPIEYADPVDEPEAPELVSGASHVCATEFDMWCWGSNRYGEISSTSTKEELLPSITTHEYEMVSLAFGDGFSLGLVGRGGAVYCWGLNDFGQCGTASSEPSTCVDGVACVVEPSPVPDTDFAQAVFAGTRHVCTLLAVGTIQCWGHNDAGQAAPDSPCASASNCSVGPTGISIGVEASELVLGEHHTCALAEQRALCWGQADLLGHAISSEAASSEAMSPTHVVRDDGQPLEGIIDLAAHGNLTCAMTEPDDVWCWGYGPGGIHWPTAQRIPW